MPVAQQEGPGVLTPCREASPAASSVRGWCEGSEEPVCGPRPWPSWGVCLGWTREGPGHGQAGRCRLDIVRPSPCTFTWPFCASDAPRIVRV